MVNLVSTAKGVTGRLSEVPGAVGYVACPSLSIMSPHHLPLKRDIHVWGASKPKPELQELMGEQEEAAKCPSQITTTLETPPLSALPVLPPSCLCQGHAHRWEEVSGASTELQARWDMCYLIRKSPWYSNAWPFPFTSPFKRCKFHFAFPSTFLYQPRGAWGVFATFI